MRCLMPFAASLAPALLLATAAAADISADQLWSAWQAGAESSGQDITAADVAREDGALRLSDVSLRASHPDGSTLTEIDWILLEETGDGRVRGRFAPRLRVTGRFTGSDGQPGTMDAALRIVDAEFLASGSPQALVQTLTAGRIELERIAVAGPDGVVADAGAMGHLADVSTRYETTGQETGRLSVTGDATAGAARLALWAENTPEAERLDVEIGFEGLAWRFDNLLVPAEKDIHPLRSGMRVAFDARFDGVRSRLALANADPARRLSMETQGGAGEISVGAGGDALRYRLVAGALRTSVAAPDLPFGTLTAEIGKAEFDLLLPLGPVGGHGDFALAYRLREIAPGPEVWMLIDATGALDRTPAAFDLAVSGRLRLPGDVLSRPMQGQAAGRASPAELDVLSIDRLALSAVGAEVRGEGTLDFPADAPPLANGVQTPVGSLRFELTGADALLERLGTLGIVPQNQVMGLRMMLSMFTIPGPDPESMLVDLDFTPEGRILANGEPLN